MILLDRTGQSRLEQNPPSPADQQRGAPGHPLGPASVSSTWEASMLRSSSGARSGPPRVTMVAASIAVRRSRRLRAGEVLVFLGHLDFLDPVGGSQSADDGSHEVFWCDAPAVTPTIAGRVGEFVGSVDVVHLWTAGLRRVRPAHWC